MPENYLSYAALQAENEQLKRDLALAISIIQDAIKNNKKVHLMLDELNKKVLELQEIILKKN